MIKVVEEFGNSGAKALLVELPQALLEAIDITSDGTVNTQSLLKVLSKYYEQHSNEITAIERINIYDAIFNPTRAVQQRGKLV